jgi:hypothetical protein
VGEAAGAEPEGAAAAPVPDAALPEGAAAVPEPEPAAGAAWSDASSFSQCQWSPWASHLPLSVGEGVAGVAATVPDAPAEPEPEGAAAEWSWSSWWS